MATISDANLREAISSLWSERPFMPAGLRGPLGKGLHLIGKHGHSAAAGMSPWTWWPAWALGVLVVLFAIGVGRG